MKIVAVALSGGIDSALAAYLLKKEGFRVIGLHGDFGFSSSTISPWLEQLAFFLQIPLKIIDLKEIFQKEVLNYFIQEYGRGRTPNPCVVCNPRIKFEALYKAGLARGADFFATGHYARIVPDPWNEGLTVARGIDVQKDQSYFLHRLEKDSLKRFLFPLGNWTKEKVKEYGRKIGLPTHPKGESQDICFLSGGDYRSFLLRHGIKELTRPGEIVDVHGCVLGKHKGLIAYTVGQRRGLGIPAAEPYYVIRLDVEGNRLVIGGKQHLLAWGCLLSDFNSLSRPPDAEGLEVSVQIRYRHRPVRAVLKKRGDGKLEARFQEPQSAVTPGQAGVVYWKDYVLGGGWIEGTLEA